MDEARAGLAAIAALLARGRHLVVDPRGERGAGGVRVARREADDDRVRVDHAAEPARPDGGDVVKRLHGRLIAGVRRDLRLGAALRGLLRVAAAAQGQGRQADQDESRHLVPLPPALGLKLPHAVLDPNLSEVVYFTTEVRQIFRGQLAFRVMFRELLKHQGNSFLADFTIA